MDANQIAAATLWAALNPEFGDHTPRYRLIVAARLRPIAEYMHLAPERRREIARMGALTRWGSATLGIMPKDSSNMDTNRIAARILAEAIGEQPKTAPHA